LGVGLLDNEDIWISVTQSVPRILGKESKPGSVNYEENDNGIERGKPLTNFQNSNLFVSKE
jgi:hypothetical protein